MSADRRVLFVHAHPDDESINNGATMARYVAEGARVTLLTCTLGEEGEIIVPALAQLAADQADQLGGYRFAELSTAMAALGVTDTRFLGGAGRWRDSGMVGTGANAHPRAFWHADPAETVDAAVAVLRDVRPQVVVTYDPDGGYGHPDHVQVHRVTTRAVELAADPAHRADLGPAWDVDKVYWTVVPASVAERSAAVLATADMPFQRDADPATDLFVTPDAEVTTAVDGSAQLARKAAAMRAHATQITVAGDFYALSNDRGQQLLGTEYYRLVRGALGPPGADGREDDLFAGLPG